MSARKNFGAKPYLFPQPVLIIGTYDENGKANAMNAAWGGIVGADEIMIDLSHHKTTENLMKTKAFTVSAADAEHMVACDYVGIVSGSTEPNKMEKAGFTTTKIFLPITYDTVHHGYYRLGERVGNAFQDGGKLK